jgi:hypothetical protein
MMGVARRPGPALGLALLALSVCAVLPRIAAAHLLPPQNATIHAVGDKVYAVVSVPVSALAAVDDDADGELSATELRRHHRTSASNSCGDSNSAWAPRRDAR